MIFIGNDIVNAGHPENQKIQLTQRYLDKCYTLSEQKFILRSVAPKHTLWTFWSCKEATYKVLLKMGAVERFSPKSLEVFPAEDTEAFDFKIHCEDQTIYARTRTENDIITSIASNHSNALECIHCSTNNDDHNDESLAVRNSLFALLPDERNWNVQKDAQNIPHLFQDNLKVKNIEISLSHDYGFVSAAYLDTSVFVPRNTPVIY